MFFKFGDKVHKGSPMFANENQQDRLIPVDTFFGDRANCVHRKFIILAQKFKFSKASKQSVESI